MSAEVWIGVATIAAIILGPVLALQIQRKLDQERETKNRKLGIFRTLMSYRATRLAPLFVQALNLIDIEFTERSEKPVRDAWKELQDHYSDWAGRRRNGGNWTTRPTRRADELLGGQLWALLPGK